MPWKEAIPNSRVLRKIGCKPGAVTTQTAHRELHPPRGEQSGETWERQLAFVLPASLPVLGSVNPRLQPQDPSQHCSPDSQEQNTHSQWCPLPLPEQRDLPALSNSELP